MDIFDHCATQLSVALLHSSGLCYWILFCASCVYKMKKSDWLVILIWFRAVEKLYGSGLVESESCGPLLPLVLEPLDSKVISNFLFFLSRIMFFRSQTLHTGDPAQCRRTLSPDPLCRIQIFHVTSRPYRNAHLEGKTGLPPLATSYF